jgi:hypothetical protein
MLGSILICQGLKKAWLVRTRLLVLRQPVQILEDSGKRE